MRQFKFAIVLLLVSAILTGCQSCSKEENVIKIGALLSLSGGNAPQGKQAQKGIAIAEEQINKAGGIQGKKIKIITEDTQTNADQTRLSMSKLATVKKVQGIVVTGDTELPEVNNNADKYGIPVMATICTGMIEENRSEWVYRYCYNEEQEDDYLMKFVTEDLGLKRMALLYPNNDAGKAFYKFTKKYIEAYGIEVVSEIKYDNYSTKENALKVINSNPEVICARGFGDELNALLRYLSELGYKGVVVGDLSLTNEETLNNTYDILDNAYIVAGDLNFQSDNAISKAYTQAYKEKYGQDQEPSFWDAVAYDSFMYLYYGLKESIEKSTDVKTALLSIRPTDLLLGENWFVDGNDVLFREMHIYRLNDKTLVKYK